MAAKILAFAGSARKGSFNKMLVNAAAEGARAAGAEVTVIDLRDYEMPIYDGDLESAQGLPANAKKLKALFLQHQGLLLACPEYNSSITPLLKNVIDWVSRKEGDEAPLACYRGKTAALVSASVGALGGLRGLVTVRSILGNIGVTVLPDQKTVRQAGEAFGADGKLKDEKERQAAEQIGARLADVVAKLNA